MALDSKKKKQYRAIAHSLKPVLIISENGLNENIEKELERALDDHELIKIKININDPDTRKSMASELAERHKAELVQVIGKMVVLLRRAKEANPKLSNLLRPI